MFFIYGWGSKSKILDYFYQSTCKNCGKRMNMRVAMTYSYFSLFFIPLIKWSKKYYLDCPHCRNAVPIDKATFLQIKNGLREDPNDVAPDPFDDDPFKDEFNQPQIAESATPTAEQSEQPEQTVTPTVEEVAATVEEIAAEPISEEKE